MFTGFRRDLASLFFTMLFPLLFLVIFGVIFGGEGASSRLPVFVTGSGPVIAGLGDDVLDIERVPSLELGVERVRDGDAVAVIAQEGDVVVVRFQGSNPVGGRTVLGIVASAVNAANLEALGGRPVFDLQAGQVEDESLGAIEFLTPGLLAWAVSIGAVFGAALTLVTWRTKGVLRRLRLSPVPAGEIALARVAVSLIVALVQTVSFLAIAVLLLDLQLSGPWWVAFPLVAVGTVSFLSIGLLVGAVASTAEAASAMANLVIVPMAFLSGAFIPLESAPPWMRAVSNLMPLTHLLDALKDVMVRDRDALSVLPHVGVLVGFAAVFTFVAIRVFRWETT